jgi:hypothetical protein
METGIHSSLIDQFWPGDGKGAADTAPQVEEPEKSDQAAETAEAPAEGAPNGTKGDD